MKHLPLSITSALVVAILTSWVHAQDVVTISSCPGSGKTQVTLEVDCTNVADATAKAKCRPFAENQACKVFPAYRTITGIHLEDICPVIKYAIYDKDKWPYQDSKDGGRAGRCGAQILTDFSLFNTSPEVGPIDVHELLHVYQSDLGAIPYQHILFGPSMTEARHMIGDNTGYATEFVAMKKEFNRNKVAYETGKATGDNQCLQAELYEETLLYMKDRNNVEQFYSKLQRSGLKDMADRTARFNRMYDAVSGGEAKPFLLAHGCPAF
jgi:hypothetical protein